MYGSCAHALRIAISMASGKFRWEGESRVSTHTYTRASGSRSLLPGAGSRVPPFLFPMFTRLARSLVAPTAASLRGVSASMLLRTPAPRLGLRGLSTAVDTESDADFQPKKKTSPENEREETLKFIDSVRGTWRLIFSRGSADRPPAFRRWAARGLIGLFSCGVVCAGGEGGSVCGVHEGGA